MATEEDTIRTTTSVEETEEATEVATEEATEEVKEVDTTKIQTRTVKISNNTVTDLNNKWECQTLKWASQPHKANNQACSSFNSHKSTCLSLINFKERIEATSSVTASTESSKVNSVTSSPQESLVCSLTRASSISRNCLPISNISPRRCTRPTHSSSPNLFHSNNERIERLR